MGNEASEKTGEWIRYRHKHLDGDGNPLPTHEPDVENALKQQMDEGVKSRRAADRYYEAIKQAFDDMPRGGGSGGDARNPPGWSCSPDASSPNASVGSPEQAAGSASAIDALQKSSGR